VGSDGLILVAPPDDPRAHVRMIMYNSDGSRAQMCGNGVRCVAKLAYERGLARVNPLGVQTDAGVLALDLRLDSHDRVSEVRVDMGVPVLEAQRIPVALAAARVVGRPFMLGDTRLALTCVSMGNPHAVFFVPDVGQVPLAKWGPQVERDPLFPERTNAHFVQVMSPQLVRMITWERGAGATQACGTGASAVCVAGVLSGLTGRAITAELPGGQLKLEWDESTGHVYMTGLATEVFTGEWPT
jgi:diaminopimelate epimerase